MDIKTSIKLEGAWLARATAAGPLSALALEVRPDPDAVRRELLAAVGGRTQWHPPGEPAPPAPPAEPAP